MIMMVSILAGCGGDTSTPPAHTNTPVAQQASTPATAGDNGGQNTPAAAATPTVDISCLPTNTPISADISGTTILGDTGFRAAANGFSFRNFGNQYPTTPGTFSVDEARRLLGDKAICAQLDGTTCTPSAEASAWIDQMNKGIDGGHCEGFAVASLELYKGLAKPSDFGADTPDKLQLDPANPSSNPALLDLIAGGWTLQTLQPVVTARSSSMNQTPNQVLDKVIASMHNGAPDPVTIAFWKPGYKEGHAVVPIWAEDKGNGVVWLHIYDNNYPMEDKYIIFDRNANTWTYSTAADPTKDASAYIGDATTFTLGYTPLSARTQPPVCPFCKNASGSGLLQASAPQDEEIMVDGDAQMIFTDTNGHKFGYDNGKFVNDVAGASQTLLPGGLGNDHGPIYNLPEGTDFQMALEGATLTATEKEEVSTFGQGMVVDIQGIQMNQGDEDSLTLSGDGHKVGFTPNGAEAPEVKIAHGDAGKDYGFDLTGLDFSAGEEMDFSFDDSSDKLAIKDTTGTPDMYDLEFTETDSTGQHKYEHKDVALNPGDTEYLDLADWQDGQPLSIGVDQGSNGSVDQTLSESDNQP